MKKPILTLVIILFSMFSLLAQDKEATQNTTDAIITFENLVHDYGTVYQGADGNCEFKFTNTGTEPLILTNVKTS